MSLKENQRQRLERYMPLWEHWRLTDEEQPLGFGANGSVYAIADDIGTQAALKMVTIEYSRDNAILKLGKAEYLEELLKRKKEEILRLSQLDGCPNIVQYKEYKIEPIRSADGGLDGYDLLIRMERLTPLDKLNARLTEEEIIRVGVEVCCGLRDANLMHRDIKPANIMRSKYGVYKLSDLGESAVGQYTRSTYGGTPYYMAPEIHRFQKYRADADVYALGIVLYELVNGDLPFYHRENGFEAGRIALRTRLQGVEIPALPPMKSGLEQVIAKAVQYELQNRYRDAQEMLTALEACKKRLEQPEPLPAQTKPEQEERKTVPLPTKQAEQETVPLPTQQETVPMTAEPEEQMTVEPDAEAMYERGETYRTEENFEEAVKCYRRAAEQGNTAAMQMMGECYRAGLGVEEDVEKAQQWYDMAVEVWREAADAGDVWSMCSLGRHYKIYEKRMEEAIYWYLKAINQGGIAGIWCLVGECYAELGDKQRAVECLEKYLETGHKLPEEYEQLLSKLKEELAAEQQAEAITEQPPETVAEPDSDGIGGFLKKLFGR